MSMQSAKPAYFTLLPSSGKPLPGVQPAGKGTTAPTPESKALEVSNAIVAQWRRDLKRVSRRRRERP